MVSFANLRPAKAPPLPSSKTEPLLSVPPVLPDLDFAPSQSNTQTSTQSYHTLTRENDAPTLDPAGVNAMPMITSTRNTSGPLAIGNHHMAPEPTHTPPSWSRSNPQSAAQSKTSQYIDKITSENERLKRELKAEKLAREDEATRVAAARSKAEESRAEHQSLQILVDTNARALERKDRKLEEMAAQLEAEVKRRRMAEQRAEEALKMLGDTRSETQRQLAAAYEQKHLAETNSQTAREGYKRMTDGHEKRMVRIKEELSKLRHERIEDADNIRRHAIVSEQLQHELVRHQRNENKLVDVLGQYKREHRKEVDALIQEAERARASLPEKEREAEELLKELRETRDRMKWVIAQSQRQGGVN